MRFDERYWYQSSGSLFSILLIPFSWLFGVVAAVRRACYRNNIFSTHRVSVPVIVVGNVTAGGTGKTPCVIALAKYFTQLGYHPGIISRGVGSVSRSKPFVVSVHAAANEAGDEAVLLARRSECPVVICKDRVAAAQELLNKYPACNLIISDDGLQHYRLLRDIEIAVVDGSRYFGNGYLLPAGPLREPLSRLSEVDFVVTNGGNLKNSSPMQMEAGDLLSVAHHDKHQDVNTLQNGKVHAVAGIGNPGKFFDFLRGLGYQIIEHSFPDHYAFRAEDLDFGDQLPILMTEKDAVKCEAFANERMWYLPVTARLDQQFLENLKEKIGKRP